MIYNYSNTAGIGRPVVVFDADGNQYRRCVEANTETGLVVYYDLTEAARGEIDIIAIHVRAPLKVTPISVWNCIQWLRAEEWFLPQHPTRWLHPYRQVTD